MSELGGSPGFQWTGGHAELSQSGSVDEAPGWGDRSEQGQQDRVTRTLVRPQGQGLQWADRNAGGWTAEQG